MAIQVFAAFTSHKLEYCEGGPFDETVFRYELASLKEDSDDATDRLLLHA